MTTGAAREAYASRRRPGRGRGARSMLDDQLMDARRNVADADAAVRAAALRVMKRKSRALSRRPSRHARTTSTRSGAWRGCYVITPCRATTSGRGNSWPAQIRHPPRGRRRCPPPEDPPGDAARRAAGGLECKILEQTQNSGHRRRRQGHACVVERDVWEAAKPCPDGLRWPRRRGNDHGGAGRAIAALQAAAPPALTQERPGSNRPP